MNFCSDNTAPAAAEILEAVAESASVSAPSYGGDAWTHRLEGAFADFFETDVRVVPLAVGTASNALALGQLASPGGTIYCHDQAHIHEFECGAAELHSGVTALQLLPGEHGRIDVDTFAHILANPERTATTIDNTASALSITQATERGTVYTPDAIAALSALAHQHGIAVHVDGARFMNAVAALDCAPADLTWRAGVDVLSFGATKNGALAAEAIVFFDRARAADLHDRQIRAGHGLSKMRFVSAQLLAYLDGGRCRTWARHANRMCQRLAIGLAGIPGCRPLHPVEINMLWTTLPDGAAARLEDAGIAIEHWRQDDGITATRLVCSWATRSEEVDRLIAIVGAR